MNALDQMIAWLSPEAGARRMRARIATQSLQRLYEGAKTGRRTDGWTTSGTSANMEIGPALAKMRDRGRDLVRNNPYAAKAIAVHEANAIGNGILAKADTKDKRLDEKIDALWKDWVDYCDADGLHDFYGLQKLADRTVVESGECLIRFRNRKSDDGFAVPLQLQLLEGDFLDSQKTGPNGDNIVIQGVEFDPIGRRVAYWLFGQHPGDVITSYKAKSLTSVRVPASEILHLFRQDRPGQVRGMTWFAPVLLNMRDIDDMRDAVLMQRKIAACFAVFVTQEAGEDGPTVAAAATDAKGQRVEVLEPGMINYMKPGEDVKMATPTGDDTFPEYMSTELHAIAAGLNITYEQLTGDLGGVNYSSYRAGQIEVRRAIDSYRRITFIPRLCNPVWRRFIDTAAVAGKLAKPAYGVKWTPPRFESIDPGKDAKADISAIRSGLLTWPEAVAANGYDPDDQMAAIADTNKKLDELGIVLDSDPRKVTQAGQITTDSNAAPKGNGNDQED